MESAGIFCTAAPDKVQTGTARTGGVREKCRPARGKQNSIGGPDARVGQVGADLGVGFGLPGVG